MKVYPRNAIGLRWAKSSLSLVNGNCVEVARLSARFVLVRDSKDPEGPILRFTSAEWHAFLRVIRNGGFDRSPGLAI